MKKILGRVVTHNDIFKIYVPLVFLLYFLASTFKSSGDSYVDHYAIESGILIMTIIAILPSFSRIPTKTLSKEYQVFESFMKNDYSNFVKYVSVIFAFPIISFLVGIYLMALTGAISSQDVGLPFENKAVLPALLSLLIF